ncbi:hypothetical protein [Treponema sp. R6D11]
MKSFFIFTAIFLFIGICSVAAQDIIVLRDGSMIEAKVSEISPTEIRYKRFNNLDGPTIVIPADRVLSIRYQNGNQEIINAEAKPAQKKPVTPAMDPDKFIFAFNANPGGLLGSYMPLCLEFGKGHFNSEVHIGFWGLPNVLATFNYFWPNSVGGFYLGGGTGFVDSWLEPGWGIPAGLNIGWKFVTPIGIYFCTGTYIGAIVFPGLSFYIKPDLAIGYCFK